MTPRFIVVPSMPAHGSHRSTDRILPNGRALVLVLLVGTVLLTSPVVAQGNASIRANWLSDGSSFWYADAAAGRTVIHRVDPRANTKEPLFDADRLRASLAEVRGDLAAGKGLPFRSFTFTDGNQSVVRFSVDEETFVMRLDDYVVRPGADSTGDGTSPAAPRVVKRWPWSWPDVMEIPSPDGRWWLGIEGRDLRLRSRIDEQTLRLTFDGSEGQEWLLGFELGVGSGAFSPDGRTVAVVRADMRAVPRSPMPYYLGAERGVEWLHAPRAGQARPTLEPYLIDIPDGRRVRIDMAGRLEGPLSIIGWRPGGSELLLQTSDRARRTVELLAADRSSGSTRVVLREEGRANVATLLEDGERFIWASERDGWNHLYLYGLDGTLLTRLTDGAFPVVAGAHAWIPETAVVAVDEERGWVYFRAQGDPQRPYDVHLYRVRLDGSRPERLTEAAGYHDIQLSPSKQFFLDTHSSLARPPVVQLRRADGTLLRTLSRAEDDERLAGDGSPPEAFIVKAADGVTDLRGALFKPPGFDPGKSYPVIEWLYAGPWTTVAPRRFDDPTAREARWLAAMGAVVFILDGRGTPGRGRAFEDVVVGNLGRHEIPDHVAALRALALERPYMDTGRVGVMGGSWGGYFTLRAMLLAPDVYRVGVAYAPAPDPRAYWADYVEPYLGLPETSPGAYEYASNTRLAANLEGELLLIHGTGDAEAPFAGTMEMVDALLRAGKSFDFIALPDENHYLLRGPSEGYVREEIRRHFIEHLRP